MRLFLIALLFAISYAQTEESLGKGKGKGGGKGKGLGPPLFGDKSKEPKNQLVPQPPPSNLKGSSTPGMESRHRPQVPLKEARIGNGDNTGQMPQVSHKETRVGSSEEKLAEARIGKGEGNGQTPQVSHKEARIGKGGNGQTPQVSHQEARIGRGGYSDQPPQVSHQEARIGKGDNGQTPQVSHKEARIGKAGKGQLPQVSHQEARIGKGGKGQPPQVSHQEARIGKGGGKGQTPQVSHKETRVGSSDMPDIVLIGDSILDNQRDNDNWNAVNPSMENALRDAGFTVKSFAKFGWKLRELEEIQYPKLVEYAEERNNDIIIIFSGGGNDSQDIAKDKTELWNIKLRVQAFGDKLLQHSSLVINITPPFDVTRILQNLAGLDWSLGTADSSFVDWYLGYDEEIMINYSEFCEPGPDGVHPDNACAQQMHQKIIDVLNRHKCSGGSCECKDEFHGYRCEEDCWTKDTWCWNCDNCCNGSYRWWGASYCSAELEAESTMNSMTALNGTQVVGAMAIFGLISFFYWIVQYFWRSFCQQGEFVKIQDAEAEI